MHTLWQYGRLDKNRTVSLAQDQHTEERVIKVTLQHALNTQKQQIIVKMHNGFVSENEKKQIKVKLSKSHHTAIVTLARGLV